jgi:hypothetical protein
MAEFHHHPDGIVYVRAEGICYAAPLAQFEADAASCALPPYAGLPPGLRERRYLAGGTHLLFTDDSQLAGGPWPEGEAYVAAVRDLDAAAARRASAPILP